VQTLVHSSSRYPLPTSILGPLGSKEVDIIGGILLILTATNPHTGVVPSTRQLAYVSRTVPYPFLSKEACLDLGIIPANFPAIGPYGFRLTKDGFKPTSEFLSNIRSFPSLKSLTDVRSWYGAINQISYSFASSQAMLPFRQLLHSQVPFCWNEELEAAFVESKEEILRQCEKGVRFYDMSLPTDWSNSCMGFWLVQRHCACPGTPTLACCNTG